MKKLLLSFLLISGIALFIQCNEQGKASIAEQSIQLDITGMTCEHGCKKAIETKVAKMDGIISVSVDFEEAQANITFNPEKTNPGEIIATIQGIGGGLYSAKIHEPSGGS
jgi:copper chaperone CopZ